MLAAEGEHPSALQYTGEHWDGDVGLLYLRARWYDPSTGRFLTQDPFPGFTFFPQTQHPYVYAANNPVRYTDPSGHLPLIATAAIGAFIGGVVNAGVQVYQIKKSDPSLTFQEALHRVDWGQAAGAAAAGGFMGLTMGLGTGGLGSVMIMGSIGGSLGGQVGALMEAAWDKAGFMLQGCEFDGRRYIQTARNSGFFDRGKFIRDGVAGAISAGIGYGATKWLGKWIYLPDDISAPKEIIDFLPGGHVRIIDYAKLPLMPVSPAKQVQIYTGEFIYELGRGLAEELLQTGVGEWGENQIVP